MNLDEAQRNKVAAWVADGLKLSEIQNRIASELGLRMTYMEVRLLVDDLKLTLKDVEPPKAVASSLQPPTPNPSAGTALSLPRPAPNSGQPGGPSAATRDISVSVDQIARPGSVVSGKVTFSDGNKAEWYVDEMGRLGLTPQQEGYRPSAADVHQFQTALENELRKIGL